MNKTKTVKWVTHGCPKCGNRFTIAHPGIPQKNGQKKTVRCVQCYTAYQITGSVKTGSQIGSFFPPAMQNKTMQRKLNSGECIDLSKCAREGCYYVLTEFVDDVDYCDAETEGWIWSIGKRKSDGKILASTRADLYENPEFKCLWLR